MKRTRWTARIAGGLLALTAFAGCSKQVFLEPSDVDRVMTSGLPPRLETHPQDPITPNLTLNPNDRPPTVLDTDRKVVSMTLHDCFLTALKQGNTGSQGGLNNAGFTNDSPGQFAGRSFGGTDSIKALAYDPSLSFLDIERSLSKFDARWITSMSWQKLDQPVAAQFVSFQNQQDAANFSSTIAKPLPTGGVAGITTSMSYSKFSNVPTNLGQFVNPNYTPRVQFVFEQPLWQQFGILTNQIANSHPGSTLIPGLRSTGQGTEGILIARIRYDQQRAEFDRIINQLLLNVESAYWDLYAAYYNLYAQEEVLKRATYLLEVVYQQAMVARRIREQVYHDTANQYWQFKLSVLNARQNILQVEARLRGLMGMRSDDGTRIVPADNPTLTEVRPNAYEASVDALAYRPELIQSRFDVKAQQLNVHLQKSLRQPDVRFFSSYDIAGLGERLDGDIDSNALYSLRRNQFNSWQLGVRADIPLGFRDANALVRQSREQLYRSWYALHDGERKVIESINRAVQNITFNYQATILTREGRKEIQQSITKNYTVIQAGQWDVQVLNQLLLNQQTLARALTDEYRQIAEYNKSLAALEWARGTIQRYNNVSIAESELPDFVNKKAGDRAHARDVALKLREHPAEFAMPPLHQYKPIADVMNPPAAPLNPEPKPLPNTPKPGAGAGPITAAPPAVQPFNGTVQPSPVAPWPGGRDTPPAGVSPAAGQDSPFRNVGTATIPKMSTPGDGIRIPSPTDTTGGR